MMRSTLEVDTDAVESRVETRRCSRGTFEVCIQFVLSSPSDNLRHRRGGERWYNLCVHRHSACLNIGQLCTSMHLCSWRMNATFCTYLWYTHSTIRAANYHHEQNWSLINCILQIGSVTNFPKLYYVHNYTYYLFFIFSDYFPLRAL